jgi:hypothetical protein
MLIYYEKMDSPASSCRHKAMLDEKDQIIHILLDIIIEKDKTINDLKNKQTPPQASNGPRRFSNHARLKCNGVKTVTPKLV